MKPDPEPPPTDNKKNKIVKKWSKMITNTIPYSNTIKPSLDKIDKHTATNNKTHQPSNKVNDSIENDEQLSDERDDVPVERNDDHSVTRFVNRIFTAMSDPDEPKDDIYQNMHWGKRFAYKQELDEDLIRYDLPLGMGIHDPVETEDNPLFSSPVLYNEPSEIHYPTVNMTQTDIQVIESKGVQTDQGANISICADRDLLLEYISIKPFNIGHAAKDAPPIVAVGKGYWK